LICTVCPSASRLFTVSAADDEPVGGAAATGANANAANAVAPAVILARFVTA
jgi:hypothetical protein